MKHVDGTPEARIVIKHATMKLLIQTKQLVKFKTG